jgi:hypothetical protein
MTKMRSNSAERNAPRASIGREIRHINIKPRMPTPGPNNYNTASLKTIGDPSSAKVPFTRAIRPISARPGQITVISQLCPGP